MISQFCQIEIVSDVAAKRRNHRLDFVTSKNLVKAGLFYIEDFPFNRQDRLEPTVSALLGRPSRGLPLNNIELTLGRIAFLAVGQLSR